jgi:hypothetical protein
VRIPWSNVFSPHNVFILTFLFCPQFPGPVPPVWGTLQLTLILMMPKVWHNSSNFKLGSCTDSINSVDDMSSTILHTIEPGKVSISLCIQQAEWFQSPPFAIYFFHGVVELAQILHGESSTRDNTMGPPDKRTGT